MSHAEPYFAPNWVIISKDINKIQRAIGLEVNAKFG
jgi:hypothetical protein